MKKLFYATMLFLSLSTAAWAQCYTCFDDEGCIRCTTTDGTKKDCTVISTCTFCIASGACIITKNNNNNETDEKYYVRFDDKSLRQISEQHARLGFILARIHKSGYLYKEWFLTGVPMEMKAADIDVALELPTVGDNDSKDFRDRYTSFRKLRNLNAMNKTVEYGGISEILKSSTGDSLLTIKIQGFKQAPTDPFFASLVLTLENNSDVWTIKSWRFNGLEPIVASTNNSSSIRVEHY